MTSAEIRQMQRELIVGFLMEQDFSGKVLDYGCGAAPYRAIVEQHGGQWHGFNRSYFPGGPKVDVGPDDPFTESWDVILCTQMLQYVPEPLGLLAKFREHSKKLVLTYATNWPEVESEDWHRFTRSGMENMLADWYIDKHRPLGTLPFGDREHIALGYGVVAT